jgi:hypothetical protein
MSTGAPRNAPEDAQLQAELRERSFFARRAGAVQGLPPGEEDSMTDTTDATPCFDATDFQDELPPPGFYASSITTARFRRSERGNDMIQVVYALERGTPSHDHVSEYFVLVGGTARGRALSRRRLVELYRACGLDPRQGDAIDPSDLLGARLEVRVEHEVWQGRPRLRVSAHRRIGSSSAPF